MTATDITSTDFFNFFFNRCCIDKTSSAELSEAINSMVGIT